MKNLYLITLREAIEEFQGRKKAVLDNRDERNSFKAHRYLSTNVLGYCDETTTYKFINNSTSKVKFGVSEFAQLCIEMEDVTAIEDFLQEVKEEVLQKREKRKEKLENQLKFL